MRTFEVWRTARNEKHLLDLCPSELFFIKDHQEICDWLCKFVVETRKGDGTEYTPRSLYLLLSALKMLQNCLKDYIMMTYLKIRTYCKLGHKYYMKLWIL